MIECKFYIPEDIRPMYDEIVPVYQAAFAGEPWFEVSKCVDRLKRCASELSSVAVGSMCEICNICPTQPAYEADELVSRFEELGASRPTSWYTERNNEGATLAAIAWIAQPRLIAESKYQDIPDMKSWLEKNINDPEVTWLDEVFANRLLRQSGNLNNFKDMCNGFMDHLNTDTLAYRTISKPMIIATERDFGEKTKVFKRDTEVPDWRDFVIIDRSK
jgi:hypothetical protein